MNEQHQISQTLINSLQQQKETNSKSTHDIENELNNRIKQVETQLNSNIQEVKVQLKAKEQLITSNQNQIC
jgi:hypothetical protein